MPHKMKNTSLWAGFICSSHFPLVSFVHLISLLLHLPLFLLTKETFLAMNSLVFFALFMLFFNSIAGIAPSSYVIFVDNHSTVSLLSNEVEWLTDRIFYTYDALRGFAALLTEGEADYIASMPGVTTVTKDQATTHLHTTRSPGFLNLNVDSGLWPDTRFADNIIIGIVDSGIWPEDESFSDEGLGPVPSGWKGHCTDAPNFNSSLCNKKLIGAKFFTTGFKNLHHPTVKQLSSSYHSPRDGDGHGTHTASTAAGSSVKHANLFGFADGTARGVATNARIATYKACVKNQCANSDMLAAMESAIQDGVHVLSLSLGAAEYPYHQNFIARGGFAAMQSGIFVTCAAGNSGPDSYSVTNTAPWLTTVGAGSIDRAFRVDVLLGDGETYVGSSLYHSSAIDTYASPLLYIGQCDTFYRTSYDLMGKIVVCTVNFPSFEFVQVVKEAGGVGTILINSVNLGETLLAISFPLPAATVGVNEGAMILTYISNTKNPTASFKFEKDEASLGKERAPILASFSSRGPNPLVPEILKPDVIAPGLNILAAFIPDVAPSESPNDPRRAKFNILSGTSMACPHVAGAAALLLGAHPSWSPAAIRSAMMTTADTIDNRGLPILNHDNTQPATALGIGAGHINPERARDPGLVYDADVSDYIAFLCGLSYTADQMKVFLAIPNPCSRSSILPGNLNYPSFSVVFRRDNKLQELTRTVTCVGKLLPEVYRVNIVNPASEKVTITVEPETLTFSNVGEKQSYKIKFEAIFTGENSSSGIEELVFGSMSWVSKTHVVRSPIGVMWITNPVESGGSEAEPPQVFKNAGAILWHKLSWFLVNVLWFLVTSVVFSLV